VKHKFKPVAKLDIREDVEVRFRARGSLRFHLLLVCGALLILLYNAFDFWVLFGELQGFFAAFDSYRSSVTALCLLSTTAALHVIHYHYRHGRGRAGHEAETDIRIEEQLRHAAVDDAEEREELIRLQMADKLKNRRLAFWHLALYLGAVSLLVFVHPLNHMGFTMDAEFWHGPLTFAGIWGIGLAAHWLRYIFTYGLSAERREARINEQVNHELERERRRIMAIDASASGLDHIQKAGETADALTLEDLEAVQERASRLPTAGSRVDG